MNIAVHVLHSLVLKLCQKLTYIRFRGPSGSKYIVSSKIKAASVKDDEMQREASYQHMKSSTNLHQYKQSSTDVLWFRLKRRLEGQK